MTTLEGKEHEAWCYFVKYPKEDLYPSAIYLNNMIKAAMERKFPDLYINMLKEQECHEVFELDHGFSLLFYGRRRLASRELEPFYKVHDKLREKLCDLI